MKTKEKKENNKNENGPTKEQRQAIEKIMEMTGAKSFVFFGMNEEEQLIEIGHGNDILLLGMSDIFNDRIRSRVKKDFSGM